MTEKTRFGWAAAGSIGAVVTFAMFLLANSGTPVAKRGSDLVLEAGALMAAGACGRAARRGGADARAWRLLCIGAVVWATGNAIWTAYGITSDYAYPFPSVADIGFIGFAIPVALGLQSFPRENERLVSRLRSGLDALLIASSVLFVSWATVLGPLYRSESAGFLSRVTGLAYPIADITIASLVLALGMRRPSQDRRPWLFLGGGLVTLAVTDSIYVNRTVEGVSTSGTILYVGWLLAFLLIALAALVPVRSTPDRGDTPLGRAQEFIPYLPFLGVLVVAAAVRFSPTDDPFLLGSGLVCLAAFAARQAMIVTENLTLTDELHARVEERTAQLRRADERFRSLVQNSTDVMTVIDGVGRVTYQSPSVYTVLGYSPETLDQIDWYQVVHPDDRGSLRSYLRDLQMAVGPETKSAEARLRHADGAWRDTEIRAQDLLDNPSVRGVVLTVRDISERKRAEEALAHARDEAVDASRAKSDFLATMSHEIRTPMNGVIGLTGLLLDSGLSETQRHHAEGVRASGEALLGIINDILDFSKIEAGKLELETLDFDLGHAVEEVAALVAESARVKGLELVAYVRPEVPSALRGDVGRLRQILLNYATNAVKFTAAGEVVLRASLAEDPSDEAVMIRFEVVDTGVGFDPAKADRLFDPFSQADASTTRRYGGTGLGLAICRRLAEAMGGTVGVESQSGQGSTFWLELPLQHALTPLSTSVAVGHTLEGRRVLMVDDNQTNRTVLTSQLLAWGIEVDTAADATEGLERLRDSTAQANPYDIAVVDMVMPGMDGLQMARAVRADPELASVALLLVSSVTMDAETATQAGFVEALTKPVRLSRLYDALMRALTPPAVEQTTAVRSSNAVERRSRGTLLIVEDHAINQEVAKGMVAKLGYGCDVAADGVEALAALERRSYDAVLMDCHMPRMDGFQATGEIRRREAGRRHIPIVALTASALVEDRQKCIAAGMDDYLAKPVKQHELADMLNRWLDATDTAPEHAGPPVDTDGVLDMEQFESLRELAAGSDDPAFLSGLVERYLQGAASRLTELQEAARRGDSAALEAAAHSLKGTSASMSAAVLASVCEVLETASSRGEMPAPEALDRISAELDRAAVALRSHASASGTGCDAPEAWAAPNSRNSCWPTR